MDKKILRKDILEKLKTINSKERLSFEKAIYNKLFENENFKKAKCIALTIPFGTEINTYPIIEKLLNEGKTVCSPICEKESRNMIFYKINSLDELVEGYYGIKTPPEKKENILLGIGEKFKYIQEFNDVFYFDDNLEDIIKNFKIHKYKKQFFNLILKAFLETDKIKENTKNKLKLYFNLE